MLFLISQFKVSVSLFWGKIITVEISVPLLEMVFLRMVVCSYRK